MPALKLVVVLVIWRFHSYKSPKDREWQFAVHAIRLAKSHESSAGRPSVTDEFSSWWPSVDRPLRSAEGAYLVRKHLRSADCSLHCTGFRFILKLRVSTPML